MEAWVSCGAYNEIRAEGRHVCYEHHVCYEPWNERNSLRYDSTDRSSVI